MNKVNSGLFRDALTQTNSSLEQKLASKTADFDKLAASNQQLTAAKQQLETRAQDLTEQLRKVVEEKDKLKQVKKLRNLKIFKEFLN